ncbi:hypothetical protein LTS18_011810 [Coniosporium uncinatum]|uniref:Uncharacterized protein n=1 Tax=Coniosporium uncinatum TaxID=93489 RepID=A0ACC3CY36_9PEZI|nr:hypothetical protein LTS18_011810 [Coniosporium uncinatum]
MDRMGYSPNTEPGPHGFGHAVLRKAILKTIQRINELIADIPEEDRTKDSTVSLLNFAITDGHSVVCTRYVSSRTDEAASLFFSSGTSWRSQNATSSSDNVGPAAASTKGDYKMERRDKGADIVLVASEPLTFERDNWVTLPTNSTLTIHKQTVMIHPIVDEFYVPDPAHKRSTQFAQTKGQTTTKGEGSKKVVQPELAVGLSRSGSGAVTPEIG